MKTRSLFTALLAVAAPVLAQHAVRPGFPNYGKDHVNYESFSEEEWERASFAPAQVMEKWEDRRYGMFIHFGLTCKPENGELSWGHMAPYAPDKNSPLMGNGSKRTEEWTTWTKDMRLEKFDAREWVSFAKQAGFRYIVVTTKHHEGFHMWDTAFSDFKVTNTPFGRDYLKELADACHEADMPLGIYFAQREWYHPDYQAVDPSKVVRKGVRWELKPGVENPMGPRHPKYIAYLKNAVRELCTNYGKVDVFWFDGVSSSSKSRGKMFTKEMWDSEYLYRMIRELQPEVAINNRASVPGDFDTPERHLGDYQEHRPWETCTPLAGRWCYSGNAPMPFESIVQLIVGASGGSGNLLLSWGPRWSGAFDEAQKQRLLEVGAWLKVNGEGIYGTRGGPWKPGRWGGVTRTGNTAYLHLYHYPNKPFILSALKGHRLQSARLLDGGAEVPFSQDMHKIVLDFGEAKPVRGTLSVALTFDGDLMDLPGRGLTEVSCTFPADPATYGDVVSRQAKVTLSSVSKSMPKDGAASIVGVRPGARFSIHTDAEAAPHVDIDLGRAFEVTGLFIVNATAGAERMATLRASVSLDGKTWRQVWQAEKAQDHWQTPVASFDAGVDRPGRKARYVRLETRPGRPTHLLLKQVEVYGKEVNE